MTEQEYLLHFQRRNSKGCRKANRAKIYFSLFLFTFLFSSNFGYAQKQNELHRIIEECILKYAEAKREPHGYFKKSVVCNYANIPEDFKQSKESLAKKPIKFVEIRPRSLKYSTLVCRIGSIRFYKDLIAVPISDALVHGYFPPYRAIISPDALLGIFGYNPNTSTWEFKGFVRRLDASLMLVE